MEALRSDTTSACFRHELAFVLGQMEMEDSIEALAACLADKVGVAIIAAPSACHRSTKPQKCPKVVRRG